MFLGENAAHPTMPLRRSQDAGRISPGCSLAHVLFGEPETTSQGHARPEVTSMAVMKYGDVEIHYEEHGRGVPVLCFAPGSLRSHIDYWHCSPKRPTEPPAFMDPTVDLAGDFRIIAMDQRNAGRSRAPVRPTDGWDIYAQDHVALLDHLGIARCHVLGACIGASFCFKLAELIPQRIASAVLMQPIGRVPENIDYTRRETAGNWGVGMCRDN